MSCRAVYIDSIAMQKLVIFPVKLLIASNGAGFDTTFIKLIESHKGSHAFFVLNVGFHKFLFLFFNEPQTIFDGQSGLT